jgi:hypothetical protein
MIQPGKFIAAYPGLILAATLLITLAAGAAIGLRGIEFDGSPETLVRRDNELQFFNEVRTTFGDDRVIIVALTTGDVFTPDFIERLDRLTSRLSGLEGVASTLSLTNIKTLRRSVENGSSEIRIENLIPRAATPEQLQSLKQSVTKDPLYAKHYISPDGRTAAASIFLGRLDQRETSELARQVERIAREEAGTDELMLAGVPIMDHRAIDSMLRDMLVISPLAMSLCVAVFLFSFRSYWGAVLPMAALLIGLAWTMGLMSAVSRPVTHFRNPSASYSAYGSRQLLHIPRPQPVPYLDGFRRAKERGVDRRGQLYWPRDNLLGHYDDGRVRLARFEPDPHGARYGELRSCGRALYAAAVAHLHTCGARYAFAAIDGPRRIKRERLRHLAQRSAQTDHGPDPLSPARRARRRVFDNPPDGRGRNPAARKHRLPENLSRHE